MEEGSLVYEHRHMWTYIVLLHKDALCGLANSTPWGTKHHSYCGLSLHFPVTLPVTLPTTAKQDHRRLHGTMNISREKDKIAASCNFLISLLLGKAKITQKDVTLPLSTAIYTRHFLSVLGEICQTTEILPNKHPKRFKLYFCDRRISTINCSFKTRFVFPKVSCPNEGWIHYVKTSYFFTFT